MEFTQAEEEEGIGLALRNLSLNASFSGVELLLLPMTLLLFTIHAGIVAELSTFLEA